MARVRLVDVCHARSGDKGGNSNVGIVAWKPEYYPVLERQVTPERVKAFLGELVRGKVIRYELPKLRSLNFILEDALDGGGTYSLRVDTQGKAMCEALLMMEIEVDDALVADLPRRQIL